MINQDAVLTLAYETMFQSLYYGEELNARDTLNGMDNTADFPIMYDEEDTDELSKQAMELCKNFEGMDFPTFEKKYNNYHQKREKMYNGLHLLYSD